MLNQQYHDTFTHCIQILNFNALLLLLTASSDVSARIAYCSIYSVRGFSCQHKLLSRDPKLNHTKHYRCVYIDYRVTADFDPHKRLLMFIFHFNKFSK